jgi:autotransporter adhesin
MAFNVNAVALGEGASAGGQGSLALGAGSGVSGSNSVALGQGSVADRDYTVSVGTAASKRQITNVADATHDSDAVTLNQLKSIGVTTDTTGGVTNAFVAYDANSAKAKVSLGGTAGTTLSNVAAGVAATDAVNKGQLDTLSNSISAVAPSLKYLRFGASTAQVANAMGADSVAIGGNSFATQTGSVAIGLFTNVSGTNSVAIGARSTVDGKNSVSLGSNSSTDEDNVISVGSLELQRRITNVGSGTTTTDAVNLGQVEDMITAATKPVQQMVKSTRTLLGAQAAPVLSDLVAVGTTDKLGQTAAIGTDAVAVGLNAQANNDNAVAIGTNVAAGGVGGVAIGNLTTSGGVNATAIGINAQSMGDTSVAIGTGVKSVGTNGVAIGNGSFTGQNATNGVAIGYKNTVKRRYFSAGAMVFTEVVTPSSCALLTASVADTPAATLLSVTGAVAPVPPSVILLCAVLSYMTALPNAVFAAAASVPALVAAVPAAVTAAATSVYVVPATVMAGLLIVPVDGSNVEPPPIAAAADDAVSNSCEPFTASVLAALSVPFVSAVIFVLPDVPFSVIVSFDVLLS